jgi:hypothetical protein
MLVYHNDGELSRSEPMMFLPSVPKLVNNQVERKDEIALDSFPTHY